MKSKNFPEKNEYAELYGANESVIDDAKNNYAELYEEYETEINDAKKRIRQILQRGGKMVGNAI